MIRVLRLAGTVVSVPLAFLGLAFVALAVLLAEGAQEVRRWWGDLG